MRVCYRRCALNGASGGADALKPTCGAAASNGGASGTARGATVRVCYRRCALNGASGGAAQVRDQRRCGWHLVGQQRHLGCDGGAPLLGFSVSLWSLALKPLHRGDGGMQGLEPPSLPIPNVSSTSGESVASSVSAASEHREGAALILLSYISTFYLSTSNTKHLQATREVMRSSPQGG